MAKSASDGRVNNNQYSAISEQVAGPVKRLANKAKAPYQNLTIDGFVRDSRGKSTLLDGTKSGAVAKSKQAARAVHRGAQRSRTLMRSVVKKPDITPSGTTLYNPKSKPVASNLSPARLSRAQRIKKNAKVKRFGLPATIRPASEPSNLPLVKSSAVASSNEKAVTLAVAKPLPSMITSVSHQHLERLLDHALFRASAHKNTINGNSGSKQQQFFTVVPRWLLIGAVLLIVLGAAGLFAWQNIPQVSVQVAAIQSDLKATVPAYSPSGFSFKGPMSASDNSVSMKFQSNADTNREYVITQQASDWDSNSLLANFITPTGMAFQSSQVRGSTVYIYGEDNHATWVNDGIWYKIDDHAKLNSDQLLKIAQSM